MGQAERKQRLYTSVDADRPQAVPPITRRKRVVEPPGIAPGSGPLIMRAFISIVGPKPDTGNIGLPEANLKAAATESAGDRPPSPCNWPVSRHVKVEEGQARRACGSQTCGASVQFRGEIRRRGTRPENRRRCRALSALPALRAPAAPSRPGSGRCAGDCGSFRRGCPWAA